MDVNKKTFLSYLELLRKFLLRCSIGVVLSSCISFLYIEFIFDHIIFAAKSSDFPTYTWYNSLTKFLNLSSLSSMDGSAFEIQNRKIDGQLIIMIFTSITFGFIISFPWILYQIWEIVKTRIDKNTVKYSILFVTVTSALFFTGVLFGFYIILPLSIHFFMNIEISSIVTNQIDLTSYISLVRTTILASGIVFVLPVVILVLHKMGIFSRETLKGYRKYAYVAMLVVSAIITPPDILSQVILVIPLVILYESSIFLSKFISPRFITK
ncbi:twin-arginine translocase subunit TatC [Myroides injenensis]|uniref:twin-arginine translocase subunit TatC n=1 Tax=Myroides injenensis TaxID=1183151 RepID=UPI002270ACE2|nr:twin-arginine translocase subunit TatC [Myroides injenensis]